MIIQHASFLEIFEKKCPLIGGQKISQLKEREHYPADGEKFIWWWEDEGILMWWFLDFQLTERSSSLSLGKEKAVVNCCLGDQESKFSRQCSAVASSWTFEC